MSDIVVKIEIQDCIPTYPKPSKRTVSRRLRLQMQARAFTKLPKHTADVIERSDVLLQRKNNNSERDVSRRINQCRAYHATTQQLTKGNSHTYKDLRLLI